MKNLIEYKGYLGSVEFSSEDEVFFGKVQGIRSLISYEGNTASELQMIIFHYVKKKTKNRKKHTKVLLTFAFPRNFTRKSLSMPLSMKCH